MRVHVPNTTNYTYPDVTVVCGDAAFVEDEPLATLLNPTLIVEVLSPSTELYDRTTKFDNYRKLATLQEYMLVSQSSARVECYSRSSEDRWGLVVAAGLDRTIHLASLNLTLALTDIYEKVTFKPSD